MYGEHDRNEDLETALLDGWLGSLSSSEWLKARTKKSLPDPLSPGKSKPFDYQSGSVYACLDEKSFHNWASSTPERQQIAAAAEQAGMPSFPEGIKDFTDAIMLHPVNLGLNCGGLPDIAEPDSLLDNWWNWENQRGYSSLQIFSGSNDIISNAWKNSLKHDSLKLGFTSSDSAPECLNHISDYKGSMLTVAGNLKLEEQMLSSIIGTLAHEASEARWRVVRIEKNRSICLPTSPPLEKMKKVRPAEDWSPRSNCLYFDNCGLHTLPPGWLEAMRDEDRALSARSGREHYSYAVLADARLRREPQALLRIYLDKLFGRREDKLPEALLPPLRKQKGHVAVCIGSREKKHSEHLEGRSDTLWLSW